MTVEFSIFPTAYWAEQSVDRVALVWERGNSLLFPDLPTELSWRALDRLIRHTVSFLQLRPNTTVVYLGEHRLAGLLCYLAVIASGGRIAPLNAGLTQSQRQTMLAYLAADRLICDDDFADFSISLTALPLPLFEPTAPATLTLTSGSTGQPKAVVHTVAQHLANAYGVCELMNFRAEHRWLLSLPLFHVSGQGIVWRWLSRGATLVIGEDKSHFYMMLAQVSHASLVPTQLQRYLAHLPKERVVKQHILLGGMALPPELITQAKCHQIVPYAGYGMTEMASTICAVANENDNVGQPLIGRSVKLVDGEIYLQGECLALGYWMSGGIMPLPTIQGWFASKDRGEWTADGKLRVIGRLDNMFISGGENIQPEQVEQCLYRSGLLKHIFILPTKDAEFGQRPVALVEFIDEFSLQAVEKLQYFANCHLEKFKRPVAYYPLNSGQYSAGIKLSRQQLQQDLHIRLTEQDHD